MPSSQLSLSQDALQDAGMRADIKFHDYQEESVRWIISRGASGLFHSPGLGKTLCALTSFKILKDRGLVKRALVVCKLRPAYKTWPDEIRKWGFDKDFTLAVLHGSKKSSLLAKKPDMAIINPEGLPWLLSQDLSGLDMLIVDESSLFKHANTTRFRCLKKLLPLFGRRVIMTGSPAPNGLLDLFGQMFILDYGESLGGAITYYRMAFFEADGPFSWKIKDGAEEKIYKRISPMILRKDAADHLDLPERVDIAHDIILPPAARKAYDGFERATVMSFPSGTEATAVNAAVLTNKLRQFANGSVYVTDPETMKQAVEQIHDAKIEELTNLYEELQGDPLMVAYEFNSDLAKLQAAFPDVPHVGGGVSLEKSNEIQDQWNAGKLPMVFVQASSIAHGLNFQEGPGRTLVWYSLTWNFETVDQCIRRIWRQGQKSKRVMIHWLLANRTVDHVMFGVLFEKERTQKRLLDALKASVEDKKKNAFTTNEQRRIGA
jgi:hypothetical protein